MSFPTPSLDLDLFLLINQQWRSPVLDVLMPILSSMTVLFVFLGIACAVMVFKYGKRQAVFFLILMLGMGMADLSAGVIKKQAGRVRPLNAVAGTYHQAHGYWDQRPVDFVQIESAGTSFPSAHSSNTMALAVLAILIWPALRKWPLILPLLVGYSRIYLGKHYPVDVLAGWLLGLIVAGVIWMIFKRGLSRFMPAEG